MNEKHYIRFWIAVVIVATLTAILTSCATIPEETYEDTYLNGALFTENDTIIQGDTMYYWIND